MKAIYINLDPYLQAVPHCLNAPQPGTVPHFDPLPLAVTIPLGETAVFFLQTGTFADGAAKINAWGDNDIGWTTNPSSIVDDTTPGSGTGGEASGVAFSSILQSQKTYWGHIGGATSFGATASVWDSEDNEIAIIPFTVLVRREQASGPVDTVDFTPPAAAPSAADIKSALIAAGPGALAMITAPPSLTPSRAVGPAATSADLMSAADGAAAGGVKSTRSTGPEAVSRRTSTEILIVATTVAPE